MIIGESYKTDTKKAVAITAAALVLGGTVVMPDGERNFIVQSVVSAKITSSGKVSEFHGFPVERRNKYSEVVKDDRQVFLRNGNELLWYNLDDLATAPRKFTKLVSNEEVFTLYGNLIGIRFDQAKKEIALEVIKGD